MKHLALATALTFASTSLLAQTTVDNTPYSFTDGVCVGAGCGQEFFGVYQFKISNFEPKIEFRDSSSLPQNRRDWALIANNSTDLFFGIRDIGTGDTIFRVDAGAPMNALAVDRFGQIGVGTLMPNAELHILAPGTNAALRMEVPLANSDWFIEASTNGLSFWDAENGEFPLVIENAAPSQSIWLQQTGNVGLGTSLPEGKLHTFGNGTQLAYFESADGGAVQVRFRSDSQNRRFLATDNDDNVKTQMQFRDDEILFLGQTSSQEWLKVSAAGIVSAGPSCNPNPCDRTFDPAHFDIPDIAERAALMWSQMHLPAVGPTVPGQPFNMTEKTAAMLHELEVAHIYIAELHDRLSIQEAQDARLRATLKAQSNQIKDQNARLAALEKILEP